MNWLINTLVVITILLLTTLSVTDIRSRIISNRVVLFLLFVIIPFSLLKYQTIFVIPALCTLIIGFLLFSLHFIGAGDIKLASVLMLAVPSDEIFSFFFFTTFAGLGLIIIGWLFFRESIKENGLPYGVAISLGFMINMALSN
ncbi:A24 family peptidase [Aggregatibacter actinomycetemcomitans]|uniref:A24 family peptidase n=1 Tax=Aggregatibacter actinomycetemcomitans TaxID=714 RepID=UPI0005A50626|nr:prepilin peptidase [Aggregatibacter actinomycetemcomitans]AMQ91252.1 flp operon protein B [Aggregatibacter actinomycetemcomitans]KOE53800.1 flp operon protein B [Aggregatibacter actinomycetemcomitans serotype b str. I23C]KOE55842.1 flp operon protein B [Aggregatibacter actinomycetemcomitans serotype b str. S23A]MBN6060284.1 prepilin peptidase [Aggregatibacter actinomycetemcomitans]MBN6088666.1 prepilin peptidase [Aggregatibacter actinomycetemcomitans]